MSEQPPDTDTCSGTDCEEPTPWDMLAVVIDGVWFCSPACAAAHVDALETPPETVTLHDPQFHANRDAVAGAGPKAVDISRAVVGMADADEAISAVSGMVEGQFRASRFDTGGER